MSREQNRTRARHRRPSSVSKATADDVVAVFATIADALARGEKVSIAGLGTSRHGTRSSPTGTGPAGENPKITITANVLPGYRQSP